MVQSQLVIIEAAPLALDEQIDLERYEATIRRAFDEAGRALRAIRDDPRKLYRQCGTFEDYCRARLGFSSERAYMLIQASGVVDNLEKTLTIVSVLPMNEAQARPLTRLDPADQPAAWQEAVERTNGRPTARVVEDVVREMRADPVNDELDPPMEAEQAADIRESERKPRVNAGLYSSATPEWYTPSHIIDRVEKVFGQIDLDPCSNSSDWREAAVPAESYYTKDDDGLSQPWHGRVYMNPPYGDEIAAWVARLINAYKDGEIVEAIALLPSRTGSAWFQPLFSYPICFVRGRLRFSGSENSAPFDSAVVYLGADQTAFNDHFQDIGRIK